MQVFPQKTRKNWNGKSMEKELYIVHCVDTEGPLNETLYDTFGRLKDFFDIELDPTIENLKKLQRKEIDLNGREDAVYQLIAPQRLNMNRTWTEVDNMLDRITSTEFRNKLLDSNGNGWLSTEILATENSQHALYQRIHNKEKEIRNNEIIYLTKNK